MLRVFGTKSDTLQKIFDYIEQTSQYSDIVKEIKTETCNDTNIFLDRFNGYGVMHSSLGKTKVKIYDTIWDIVTGIINYRYHMRNGNDLDEEDLKRLAYRVKMGCIENKIQSIIIWYIYYLYRSTKYIDCYNDQNALDIYCTCSEKDFIKEAGITIGDMNQFVIKIFIGKRANEFLEDITANKIDDNSSLVQLYHDVLDSLIDHLRERLNSDNFQADMFIQNKDYRLITYGNSNDTDIVEKALACAIDQAINENKYK